MSARAGANEPRLVLASASPQRRAILGQLGVAFDVVEPGVEELTEGDPAELVVENARRKARGVAGERVIAADTAVVLDGRVLGKPVDEDEARAFLEALAGRDHHVLSGVAVRDARGERTGLGSARVRFRALALADVDRYVATGEWRGRAGGYAIQGRGAALVEEIEGDYWAVVGLPVAEIARLVPHLLGLEPG
jgi:septum formation protein